ncbi:MAG: NUDIX hydrolase [Actinomycetota bacterium]
MALLDFLEPVRAAGGVVSQIDPDGPSLVLVVHRPRYDDWSFPKGKTEPGETDEQCALREVEEETGYACKLGRELPGTSYEDRQGRPKTVRYWAMVPVDGKFISNSEVDEARWLRLDEAQAILSYDHDRELTRSLMMQEAEQHTVLLVRHGSAGSRKKWSKDDRLRPLDQKGRRQAAELIDKLGGFPVRRILSSGYLRCMQTVEPLGKHLGLEVERAEELEEGASAAGVSHLLAAQDGLVVLCTHGDVSQELLGPGVANQKGSVWVLRTTGSGIELVNYLDP